MVTQPQGDTGPLRDRFDGASPWFAPGRGGASEGTLLIVLQAPERDFPVTS